MCALLLSAGVHAGCVPPLPPTPFAELDRQVDLDPVQVVESVDRLLPTQAATPLAAGELLSIQASAFNLLDDDDHTRRAVARARTLLAMVADGPEKVAVMQRLDFLEADAPRDQGAIADGIRRLSDLVRVVPADSVTRACVLVIRSSLNAQLVRDDDAVADALTALDVARLAHSDDAIAEANYQIAGTYVWVGLDEEAIPYADAAASYARREGWAPRLGNALYAKAEALRKLGRFQESLDTLGEVRAINIRLRQTIDVAYDDQRRCRVLVEMRRLVEAREACLAARGVLMKAGREDIATYTDEALARADLMDHHPEATVARLDRQLAGDIGRIPARLVPRLYRLRSEALAMLGRQSEALNDQLEAYQRMEAWQISEKHLDAARIKERFSTERLTADKRALQREVDAERAVTAGRTRALYGTIALAVSIILLLAAVSTLLSRRARFERVRRQAAETIDAQSHIISKFRDAILLVNGDGTIRHANDAATRLFGPASLVGASIGEARFGALAALAAGDASAVPRELRLGGPAEPGVLVIPTFSQVVIEAEPLTVCVLQDVTELRRLERTALDSIESERTRHSHEIHEGIAQDLSGISMLLTSGTQRSAADPELLRFAVTSLNETVGRARALAKGLTPVQLARGSLEAALRELAAHSAGERGLAVDVECRLDEFTPGESGADRVYRMVASLLDAAAAHRSTAVDVDLTTTAAALRMTVTISPGNASPAAPPTSAWDVATFLVQTMNGSVEVLPGDPGTTTFRAVIPRASLITP